jgi:hypothetical protein
MGNPSKRAAKSVSNVPPDLARALDASTRDIEEGRIEEIEPFLREMKERVKTYSAAKRRPRQRK